MTGSFNLRDNLRLSALLKYGVPVVVSIGLCYLLFRDFDFDGMWQLIRSECHFGWIVLALFISVLSHIFRAMRWRIQLDALGVKTPLFPLVLSIFGTYAVNLVFPRLGEVWRTGYIASRQKAPFATVFGSMVADRLADTVTVALLTLLTFVLASSSLISYMSQNKALYDAVMTVITSPWLWIGAVGLVGLVWYLLRRNRDGKFVKSLVNLWRELWQGFAVIVRMPGKGRWLVYTVGVWGCYFIQLYVAFFSFGFTSDVVSTYGVTAVLVTFVFSSISMGVPSNGGIGPWQWAVIFALDIYGVKAAEAGAFANLVLGCNTLLLIALGLFTFICITVGRHSNVRSVLDNNPQLNKQE